MAVLAAAAVALIWFVGQQLRGSPADRLAAPQSTETPQRSGVADVSGPPAVRQSTAAAPALREPGAPRRLSPGQRDGIAEQLRPLPPIPLDVAAIAGDEEAMAFAQQFKEVLDGCGWRVPAPVWTPTEPNKAGTIGLLINGVEAAPSEVILLQATLKSVGIAADAIIDPSIPPGNVRLVVGRRE